MDYQLLKLTVGVIGTIGLYSSLYKENKFYRLMEHLFLGLAAGYTITSLWTETLADTWWDKMVGKVAEKAGQGSMPGYWGYAFLLPIGLMGYFVFNKKHNWLSKIPIGIILGLFAGQQIQAWWNRYGPQINASMKPMLPTTTSSFIVPSTDGLSKDAAAAVAANVYPSQAISNIIFVVTLLTALSYFLFSFDLKNKFLQKATGLGRLALMVGFGAIFGSTVLMRFTLLIDRMYFIWIEWLMHGVLHK
jgi:hypothetical protein